jgi:hypothetical protein
MNGWAMKSMRRCLLTTMARLISSGIPEKLRG